MLKRFLANLSKYTRQAAPVDPKQFSDPMAEKTIWVPLKSGGASFCTHRLRHVSPQQIKFVVSPGALFFALFFCLAGLGLTAGFVYSNLARGVPPFTAGILFPVLMGLAFAVAGGAMLVYGFSPATFDKQAGYFWKGRKNPRHALPRRDAGYTEIDRIHAIQLISEYCRGNKNSYYSYELNLVLTDGSRINVTDHGNLDTVRRQALDLSRFLEKPVWDGIS